MRYLLLLSLFSIGCAGGTAATKIQPPVETPVETPEITNETAAGVYYNADKTRSVTLTLNGTATISDGACTAAFQHWAIDSDIAELGERIALYIEESNSCALEFAKTENSALFHIEYSSYYAGQENRTNCVWTGLHVNGTPEEFCKE